MTERAATNTKTISLSVVGEIAGIDAKAWDLCARTDAANANPFVSHAFLSALETSGCVKEHTGWIPQHIVLRENNRTGTIEGVMPCYVKTHSQGEYVFDHAWADALERAGGHYYPKLQCAVPFTPVPGPRILIDPAADQTQVEQVLAAGAVELTQRLDLSSLHLTFVEPDQCARLSKMGFLTRTDQQFHWHNDTYKSFDDFLETLSSRKRKTIRKERERARDGGITIEHLRGDQITTADWDAFFEFYIDTGERKWGSPYLNREFFELLSQTMPDACLLIVAKRDGQPIAAALNIVGNDTLFGRYWGAREHIPCLHFEVCYYQAIDYAIEHRLQRVEAGAQGQHKLARGYIPVTTFSAHWIANKSLRDAVARYLKHERSDISHLNTLLMETTPYKKTTPKTEGS